MSKIQYTMSNGQQFTDSGATNETAAMVKFRESVAQCEWFEVDGGNIIFSKHVNSVKIIP